MFLGSDVFWLDAFRQNPVLVYGEYRSLRLSTPKATLVERSQLEIEQFLAMLRFENRSKLEELPGILK